MDTSPEEPLESPEQSIHLDATSTPASPVLELPKPDIVEPISPPMIEKPVNVPPPQAKPKTTRRVTSAPPNPMVSLQRGLQLFEEIKMIQVTGEENLALKELYTELHNLLTSQVEERANIIAALENELHRADESLNTWHASRTTARDAIEVTRNDHAKDLQKLQDNHRNLIGDLRIERQTQESMWTSNSDIRVERDHLREALAIAEREAVNARRHHQFTLSALEHSCLLERAMTKHAMQVKLRATREAMAASVGAGLGERTVQAVEESREGERELSKQGFLAQAAMEEHQKRREALSKARRELCLLVDSLGHSAYRESSLQKEVKMYSERLEMLHQYMENEDGIEEYERWKQNQKSSEDRKNDNSEYTGLNAPAKPWDLDTTYVQQRSKLRALTNGHSTARETIYPQQYRGGTEFHRPVTTRILVPEKIQESRNREIVTADFKFRKMRPNASFVEEKAKRAVLPDSGSVRDIEQRITSLMTSISKIHKKSKALWKKAQEYENRTSMVESMQEESVRLVAVAEEDVRHKLLKQQLLKEKAELLRRKKLEDEFDPILNKSGLFSTMVTHKTEINEGVRWNVREGIPPVLSKIDPRDVQQFLQALRGQLEETNTQELDYDYDDYEEDEDEEGEELSSTTTTVKIEDKKISESGRNTGLLTDQSKSTGKLSSASTSLKAGALVPISMRDTRNK